MVIGRIQINKLGFSCIDDFKVCVNVSMRARMRVCIFKCASMYACMHVRPIVCLYLRTHTCRPTQADGIANMFVFMYAYMYRNW